MSRLLESLRQQEMENPFPPWSASLGNTFPPSMNLGMPSSTPTQEPENPFQNTILGSNTHDEDKVYQDEDPIEQMAFLVMFKIY